MPVIASSRQGPLGRLWLQIAAPIAVVLVMASFGAALWTARVSERVATEAAAADVVRLGESIGGLSIDNILRRTFFDLEVLLGGLTNKAVIESIMVLDRHGRLLASDRPLDDDGLTQASLDRIDMVVDQRAAQINYASDSVTAYTPVPYLNNVLAVVRIERSLSDIAANAAAVKVHKLWSMGLAALFLSALAALIVMRSTRRLHRLTAIAHQVGKGDWSATVKRHGRDEIGDLEQGFQTMLAAVADNLSEIETLAFRDRVTGLANRAYFQRALGETLGETHGDILGERHGDTATQTPTGHVLFLDLDRFKAVNDVMGHSAGDTVLADVSARLQDVIDRCGVRDALLARLGGDEFTVLLTGTSDAEAHKVAGTLIASFQAPFKVATQSFSIGCSIGLCAFPYDAADVDGVLRKADLAMYHAKQSGRGRVMRYSPALSDAVERRADIQLELAEAIDAGALDIVYQPQVRTDGHAIVGVEALVRWTRRCGEEVPPSEFVAIAEDIGLIVDLGGFVMERALRDVASLHARGHAMQLSVNVSPLQLFADGFADGLEALLAETGFDPTCLEIEITETTAITSPDRLTTLLTRLRAHGIRFAIDDFGVGYSSLSTLSALPFDTLKIDRSFVSYIGGRDEAKTLLSTIAAMANSLGLETVAEGVECQDDADYLEVLDISIMQGFHFARPEPLAALERRLNRARGSLARAS